jgi:hypothetical protein
MAIPSPQQKVQRHEGEKRDEEPVSKFTAETTCPAGKAVQVDVV